MMLENKKLLSIIITIYNTEDYLEQCLNSILMQNDDRIELVLINNGSGTKASNICESYIMKHSNIRYINVEKNEGVSNARNIGLSHSKGEYVWFFDSDDYIENGLINQILINISKHIEMILLNTKAFDDKTGKLIDYIDRFDSNKIGENINNTVLYLIVNGLVNPAGWNKIILKDFLIKNGIYFKNNIRGEDVEWVGHLFLNVDSISTIDEPCYMYRVRSNSTSRTDFSDKCWNDCYKVVFDWYTKLKDDKSDLSKYLMSFYNYQFFILLGKVHYYKDKKNKINMLKQIIDITDYAYERKCRIITKIFKVFGIKITSYILYFYLRLK